MSQDSTNNVVPISTNRAVYTVQEVAYLLSLSRSTTYTMVRKGEIPAVKFGDRWVIPKSRFHQWLDNLPEATVGDVGRELEKLNRKDSV